MTIDSEIMDFEIEDKVNLYILIRRSAPIMTNIMLITLY
jgi:hypothetical protein